MFQNCFLSCKLIRFHHLLCYKSWPGKQGKFGHPHRSQAESEGKVAATEQARIVFLHDLGRVKRDRLPLQGQE